MMNQPPLPVSRSQRGFSLTELIVTVMVLSVLLLGILAVFDYNSKVARVQMQIADMQQSLRVGQDQILRVLRMTGRGGLSTVTAQRVFPLGAAIEVRNDVGVGAGAPSPVVAPGFTDSPEAVEGTDILIVRGVFDNPIYQINPLEPGAFTLLTSGATPATDPRTAVRGTVTVCDISHTSVPQGIDALELAIDEEVPLALVLVSATDERFYAVVELDPVSSVLLAPPCGGNPASRGVQLAFNVTSGVRADTYRQLGGIPITTTGAVDGNLPARLDRIAWVGIVEEHRYYVREEFTIPGDDTSDPSPRLARARLFPGTEDPLNGLDSLQEDIADNILDLQVALGIDRNGDAAVLLDDTPTAADEWLYNHSADDPANAAWLSRPAAGLPGLVSSQPLHYARITLLARTDRRDPNYQAPLLTQIESHTYASSHAENTRANRMFRRRTLQTWVDLRNL